MENSFKHDNVHDRLVPLCKTIAENILKRHPNILDLHRANRATVMQEIIDPHIKNAAVSDQDFWHAQEGIIEQLRIITKQPFIVE